MDASEPTPTPPRRVAKAKTAPDAGKTKPATKAVANDEAAQPAAKAPAAKARKQPSQRVKPLNFRVTAEFRKAFKQAAAAEDCKKVELLERMFTAWQKAGKAS